MGVGMNMHVVEGAIAQLLLDADLGPAFTEVIRAIHARIFLGFNERPDASGFGRRGADADLADQAALG